MQRKLLYIVNPISGIRNKKNLREILEQETKKTGFPFAVYPSVADGDYSFLHPVIKDRASPMSSLPAATAPSIRP